jgi:hypothetical protein
MVRLSDVAVLRGLLATGLPDNRPVAADRRQSTILTVAPRLLGMTGCVARRRFRLILTAAGTDCWGLFLVLSHIWDYLG